MNTKLNEMHQAQEYARFASSECEKAIYSMEEPDFDTLDRLGDNQAKAESILAFMTDHPEDAEIVWIEFCQSNAATIWRDMVNSFQEA